MCGAEQDLAQKCAADARVDLVVARRWRSLAGDLPEGTARERVTEAFPESETRRSRERVVHRSLVGVTELIDVERVGVDDPAAVQVVADRVQVACEIITEHVPVILIQKEVEADDLECGNRVAFAAAILP